MRNQSKKRQRLMRKWGPVRNQFLLDAKFCWICGSPPATDCHEMTNGPNREAAISVREAWLATCTRCNQDELTDKAKWPLARQLAIKWCYDRDHFNLKEICHIMGRDLNAITFDEVLPFIHEFRAIRNL